MLHTTHTISAARPVVVLHGAPGSTIKAVCRLLGIRSYTTHARCLPCETARLLRGRR